MVSVLKEIGGKLANIVIGHFPEANDVKELDVCSMEADITTENDVVEDVNEISGIALGNSHKEHPAFPGAIRLASVQCFDTEKPGEGERKMGETAPLTFEQVRAAVKSMNIYAWQLFSLEDIKNDKVYGKLFEDNTLLKAENERLDKENKEISSKNKEALRSVDITKAETKVKELLKEGHTDKQVKFILNRFKPETMEDLSDDGLNKFLENTKKEFAETAKLFGVTETQSAGASDSSGGTKEDETTAETMEDEALKILGVK